MSLEDNLRVLKIFATQCKMNDNDGYLWSLSTGRKFSKSFLLNLCISFDIPCSPRENKITLIRKLFSHPSF